MKSIWREICFSFFMGAIVPAVLLAVIVMFAERTEPVEPPQATRETAEQRATLTANLRFEDGRVVTMDMDTYLVGVVLAEMPASFEMEALKAQAVVARTYARRAALTGGKHGDGSVCGLYSCCQAYISQEEYLNKGGTEENVDKIRSAVEATSGYVVTYQGEPIEATYFSCSGGITEDAVAVWGTEYPYLQSVDSPGEEGAKWYTDSVRFTAQEFQNKLGVTLSGEPNQWFGAVTYTEGSGVDTMMIGDVALKGTDLRKKLGLRSTNFTLEVQEGTIVIHTRGYGHRVGMSQYGADAMALQGSTYQEILAHYYQGTELAKVEDGT